MTQDNDIDVRGTTQISSSKPQEPQEVRQTEGSDQKPEGQVLEGSALSSSSEEQVARLPGEAMDTGKRIDIALLQQRQKKTVRRKPQKGRPRRGAKKAKSGEEGADRQKAKDAPRLPKRAERGPEEVEGGLPPKIVSPEPVIWDDSGDFGAMLDAQGGFESPDLDVGQRVKVTLRQTIGDTAFFALGRAHEAMMPLMELRDADGNLSVVEGEEIEAFVVSLSDGVHLSKKLSRFGADLLMLESAKENRMPVEGRVEKLNKGGLEVSIAGGQGFCPLGQIDLGYVESPENYVGQTLSFQVMEVGEKGRNVLLSRRALLAAERAQKAEALLERLEVGAIVAGKVTRITHFGAFVDLGGLDGLVPIGELAWGQVASVAEVVSEGLSVMVRVLRIEDDPKRPGRKRIGLSLKGAGPDPWVDHREDLQVGSHLEGRVVRLEIYGAFVELFPGLEGLIHISELSVQRVRHPEDVLQVDQPVTVRLLKVDEGAKRISLSLREAFLGADPSSVQAEVQGRPKVQPSVGQELVGTVSRVERYGVFLELESGQSALIHASETGLAHGADLKRHFPLGQKERVMILEPDPKGRMRVSKKALAQAVEETALANYQAEQKAEQSSSFGTMADLLKNIRLDS